MRRYRGRLFQGLLLLLFVLMDACAPPKTIVPEVINIYASSSARPWLGEAYNCAPPSVGLKLSPPDSADIALRLADPIPAALSAFQIGVDDILIVVHPQAGIGSLTLEQARGLFSGQIGNWKSLGGPDLAVQVWAYSPTEDVQVFFDRVVMQDRPITSFARLAVSAQAMSDEVGNTPGSIGILPRRWKAGNTGEALMIATVPVLASVKTEPQGNLRELIYCLQSAN